MVFRSFSRLILSLSFLCSSVYVALFALSFSFLSERFSSVHAKAATAYSRRVLLVGFYRPILTLSMRAFGPRISAYAFWTTTDIPTDIYIPLVLTPNAWTFGKWSPEEWNGIAFHEVLWSLLFAKTRQNRRPRVTSTDGC